MRGEVFRISLFVLGVLPCFAGETISEEPAVIRSAKGGLSSAKSAKGVIWEAEPRRAYRFGGGFSPLIGADVSFSGLGSYQSPFAAQPLGGGEAYRYDDGFVLVDGSGNAGNLTSFWGYENNSQYSVASDNLSFNISNSLSNASTSAEDDFSPGFEFFGEIEMGDLSAISFKNQAPKWGLRANFQYVRIDAENSTRLFSDLERTTDRFPLNGVIPPLAPFNGTSLGPNALIGDSPNRGTTIVSNGAIVDGNREFSANLFGIGFGSYLEYQVTDRFFVGAEAGLNLALISGDYSFSSQTTIPGVGVQTSSGSESETKVLPGFNVGLRANYFLTPNWFLYGNAKYQYYSSFDIQTAGSEAELSLDGPFSFALGAGYQF